MRYVVAAFLFFAAVAGAALLVFSVLLGVSPALVVLMVAVLYALGLAADLLPPGYPPLFPFSLPRFFRRDIDGRAPDEIPRPIAREARFAAALPPEDAQILAAKRRPVPPRSRKKRNQSPFAPSSEAAPQHRWHSAPAWVIAAGLVVAVFVAGWFISGLRDSGGGPPAESAVAAFNGPTSPAAPGTTSAAPTAPGPPLGGTWLLTDTVTDGPGLGQSFQLNVALTESNGTVTGAAEGMTLSGTRDGDHIELTFARVGSKGSFTWSMTPDGKLNGSFTDTSPGSTSKGTSLGERQQ